MRKKRRIKPHYRGRNDGFSNDTYRYWGEVDEEGYFYEVYTLIDRKVSRIVITDHGVSIDFRTSGESIMTNLTPGTMFPNQRQLEWEHLEKIVKVLENTGLEGQVYSKAKMDALYQRWKDLGEP